MGDYWFTSDWHLGHERILELCDRPFRDLAHMHDELIQRHNDVVRPDDTVWVLGDVCMGPINESLALVSRFHGRKMLVAGNHDRCFHGYGDNRVNREQLRSWMRRYQEAGFAVVLNGDHIRRVGFGALVQLRAADRTGRGKLISREVTAELCHFPTGGESQPDQADRFVEYRPRPLFGHDYRPSNKRWVICGHVHTAWRTCGRNVNVGVDAWEFAPVHQDVLAQLIVDTERQHKAALDGLDVVTATTAPLPTRTHADVAEGSEQ